MKTFLKVWLSVSFIAIAIGIGIIILAFTSGASIEDYPTFSVRDSYEDVKRIDFDIAYGDVEIIEGDSFHINAENYLEDDLESYVSDGTWYIRENTDNKINLFGMRFVLRQLVRWDNDYTPRMTITIPKGFIAEEFILGIGAGNVEANEINALRGNFTVDAGRLSIQQLSISEKSEYDVGAGEMVLNNVTIKDISVNCDVGHIEIDGAITGDNKIECSIGKVDLSLDGSDKDYSYNISADIGSVEIEGDDYHSLEKIIDNGTDNHLDLECEIGSITVDFN